MVDFIKPHADSIQFDGLGSILICDGIHKLAASDPF
jgi:hypothetical protein